ncbi:MAG: OmpA family protein [Planctomycetes bacterium]|nr:OmpA family protein [Planctomycetota bacterium]
MAKSVRMVVVIMLIVGMVWIAGGCVSLGKYKKMENKYRAEIEALNNQRNALKDAKEDIEKKNYDLSQELGIAKGENAALTKKWKAEQMARARLLEGIGSKLRGIEGIEITPGGIEIQGEVLFDSGKVTLKESGKEILGRVAEVFKQHPDYIIRVDGHTDTDPIDKSAGEWKTRSNFELGAYRALKVLLYFQEQGIDPAKMFLCSFGEHQPKSEKKAENRRVVIGFMPVESKEAPEATDEKIRK